MRNLMLTLLSLVFVFTQSCTTKDEESLDSETRSELVSKNDLYIERALITAYQTTILMIKKY